MGLLRTKKPLCPVKQTFLDPASNAVGGLSDVAKNRCDDICPSGAEQLFMMRFACARGRAKNAHESVSARHFAK